MFFYRLRCRKIKGLKHPQQLIRYYFLFVFSINLKRATQKCTCLFKCSALLSLECWLFVSISFVCAHSFEKTLFFWNHLAQCFCSSTISHETMLYTSILCVNIALESTTKTHFENVGKVSMVCVVLYIFFWISFWIAVAKCFSMSKSWQQKL